MHQILFGSVTVGTALAYLGGGVGVSIVVQLFKRVFGLKSSKIIQSVVAILSVAASALAQVISVAHTNPTLLAGHAVGILGLANAAHTFIVSDADQFIGKVKTALNTQAVTTPPSTTVITPTEAKPAQNTNTPPPSAAF